MSDDGTKAAKKIAYAIQLEGSLASAKYFCEQMREFHWWEEQEAQLSELHQELIIQVSSVQKLVEQFYKVIGES